MNSIVSFMCIIICILAIPVDGWTHGVRGRVDSGSGFLVEAEYDDSEPMSYANIEITASKENLPFQTGRTDRNGCFLFRPDNMGDWEVVVSDGMGHRLVLKVNVDESLNMSTSKNKQAAGLKSKRNILSRQTGAITGISIIFGICGSLFGWMCHKKLKDKLKLNGEG